MVPAVWKAASIPNPPQPEPTSNPPQPGSGRIWVGPQPSESGSGCNQGRLPRVGSAQVAAAMPPAISAISHRAWVGSCGVRGRAAGQPGSGGAISHRAWVGSCGVRGRPAGQPGSGRGSGGAGRNLGQVVPVPGGGRNHTSSAGIRSGPKAAAPRGAVENIGRSIGSARSAGKRSSRSDTPILASIRASGAPTQ
jgi:hypothetical protein